MTNPPDLEDHCLRLFKDRKLRFLKERRPRRLDQTASRPKADPQAIGVAKHPRGIAQHPVRTCPCGSGSGSAASWKEATLESRGGRDGPQAGHPGGHSPPVSKASNASFISFNFSRNLSPKAGSAGNRSGLQIPSAVFSKSS
jgi:hypothetical protein